MDDKQMSEERKILVGMLHAAEWFIVALALVVIALLVLGVAQGWV